MSSRHKTCQVWFETWQVSAKRDQSHPPSPELATWLIRSDSWQLHGQQPPNRPTDWSIRKRIWTRLRYD